jgi:hypothetical protein
MTPMHPEYTRFLLCGAVLSISAGCGGKRFESETNALEPTAAPENVAPFTRAPDAGPTSPDTEQTSTPVAPPPFSPESSDGGTTASGPGDPSGEVSSDAEQSVGSTLTSSAVHTSGEADAGEQSTAVVDPSTGDQTAATSSEQTLEPSGPESDTETDNQSGSSQDSDPFGTNTDVSTTDSQSSDAVVDCDKDQVAYDGHCYFFRGGGKSWRGARDACRMQGEGWDLASIDSLAEHEWVSKQLEHEAWLGGIASHDEWRWTSNDVVFWSGNEEGSAVDDVFTWWEDTEPNGDGIGDQCLRYSDDSGAWAWTDMPCDRMYGYVCEQVD